ncbi:MAG: 50S ribosomal protein L22 [Candidatus Nealsonbacteria bacterium]|nr:50S ribosomal protein L22 [Candidatus Nealsonbacteria bacterium]
MPVTAKLNYLRISPRKVRLVADLIRGKNVEDAQTILNFTTKKSAPFILKLLKSAIANARNNFQLEPANLYISKITVDEGPKYKRWMPRARGAVSGIQKKTSYITMVLEEARPTGKKVKPSIAFQKEMVEGKEKIEKEVLKVKKSSTAGQTKLRPEEEILKPKAQKGIKRIFQRKTF